MKKGFAVIYIGLAVIALFLVLASLAPKIGKNLGFLSQKKQTQESQAAVNPSPTSTILPEGPCPFIGDANNDKKVDVVDALTIQRFVAGLPISSWNSTNADVDGNKKVDVVDALKIQRYVAGLINNFDACPKPSTHEIYSLQLLPTESITVNSTVSSGVQALLYFNGQVVINQSDFQYSWAISAPGTNIKISPFAVCTKGIQQPCPMDHANIYGSAPSGTKATVVVNVSKKSTNATVTQGAFILNVK